MRKFDLTRYDVKITIESDAIESTILTDILDIFKKNGYAEGTRMENQFAISYEFNKKR